MKKYQVETWFKITKETDSYEEAKKEATMYKNHSFYKDTIIRKLKVTEESVERL